MNSTLLFLLTLTMVSCGGELVDTDGIQEAAIKASQNIKEALTGEELQTSTIVRRQVSTQNPQKILSAPVDSLKSLRVTITKPRNSLYLFQSAQGELSIESLGLIAAYEGSELLPIPESINMLRSPQNGATDQIIVDYEVDGNIEGLLEIFIGNNQSAQMLVDLKIQMKSKTNLNHRGENYENLNL